MADSTMEHFNSVAKIQRNTTESAATFFEFFYNLKSGENKGAKAPTV